MCIRQTLQDGGLIAARAIRPRSGLPSARRGAGQLHLHLGQADHADPCGAGHLVWGRSHLRRRPAHARCLCARRHHHFCVAKADFKKILAAHTEFYEAMLRLHARRIRQLYGLVEDLNTLPCGRAFGQAAHAPGAQLWHSQFVGRQRDAHWPATGPGRAGAIAGRIAPAGQPGTQSHGTRGCDSHRAGWLVVRATAKL